MNLLIVDDDVLAVEGLQMMTKNSGLVFNEIFTAYNMSKAQSIIMENEVNILLCDIEMPKGSGLELVEWINDQGYDIACMFLTSYAQFDYASKALKLNAVDYILKPVPQAELEKALIKAINIVNEKDRITDNQKYAEYWNSHLVKNNADFWKKVLVENQVTDKDKLIGISKKYGIQINEDKLYYPIYIAWCQVRQKENMWDTDIVDFIIKNIASEILYGATDSLMPISIKNNHILILYIVNNETEALLQEKCGIFVDICRQYYSFINISCYVNKGADITDLANEVKKLTDYEKYDVVKKPEVINIAHTQDNNIEYEKPDMDNWMHDILSDKYTDVINTIKRFLDEWAKDGNVNIEALDQFRHDFLQEIYIALRKKGIQAHSVFQTEAMKTAFDEACISIYNMKNWIELLISALNEYQYEAEASPTVIDEVKQYIEEHLADGITRTELATKVYLHPDYLSHIFKNKMNMSISDYILQARICEAKRLLMTTDDSIREIAISVGCSNIAYFSKIFKKCTGYTPKDYRKNKE